MEDMTVLKLVAGRGVEGDRYFLGTGFHSGRREAGHQITLFESETLDAILLDHEIGLGAIEHRRNVTTVGVPLSHLVGRRFRVGDAILEGIGLSRPCKHIEEVTSKAIYNCLINRSGLNAKILKGAAIRIGDVIEPV
jgi:MOSC domain-containing protein YiiM